MLRLKGPAAGTSPHRPGARARESRDRNPHAQLLLQELGRAMDEMVGALIAVFDHVLDHGQNPYHRGPCPAANHCAEWQIPSCGDRVRLEFEVHDGVVREAWFTAQGFLISQAAASMLVEFVEHRPIRELTSLTAHDMLALFRAPLTPRRRPCCLLAWEVLQLLLRRAATAPDPDGMRDV